MEHTQESEDAVILARLEKRLVPIPACGCEVWEGALDNGGYGLMRADMVLYKVHRLRWILKHGAIPEDLQVLHKCDVRCCAALEHLYLGDQLQNMQDASSRGRMMQKLSDTQIEEIRASTDTQRALAERYGVDQTTIWYWKRT